MQFELKDEFELWPTPTVGNPTFKTPKNVPVPKGPFTVTVDNVIYYDFPTCERLLQESTGLAKSFMRFLKELNIFTHNDLMCALSTNDSREIGRLLCKIHRLESETPPNGITPYFKAWQTKMLRGSQESYRISLFDAAKKVNERTKFPNFDAIKEEVGLMLGQLEDQTRSSDKDLLARIKFDNDKVEQLHSRCELKPIKDWREAVQKPDYLKTVFGEYFPDVSCQTFSKYLFNDRDTCAQVIYLFCLQHGVNVNHRHFDPDNLEEYLAFIKWAKSDANAFLKEHWNEIWSEDTF